MNWLAAFTTGIGAGLAYYGLLWLTLRLVLARPGCQSLLAVSYLARLGLLAATFRALSASGWAITLSGLAGLLLARHRLLTTCGGVGHGC